MTWRHRSACREVNPELFFPIGNAQPAQLQIERARVVCLRCNVVEACLTWAMESEQNAGVLGGLSETERQALRRRSARAARAGRVAPTLRAGAQARPGPTR